MRRVRTGLGWTFLVLVFLLLCGPLDHPEVAGGIGAAGAPCPEGARVPWGVERIRAPEAWLHTTGVPEVVVAVIDSGIDRTVPQLAKALWVNPGEIPGNGVDDDGNGYVDDVYGWDFRDGVPTHFRQTPIHWHGTFVAGIIAAQHGLGEVAGVAPRIRIMDVRFLDGKGLFYTKDWALLAAAIDYAVNNGARVINLSLYAKIKPAAVVEEALARAAAKGVIVVGIAGNESRGEVFYPAKYPSVLAVAATDRRDALASFSNWGPEVAVAAPGEGISSVLPGGAVGTYSGTSFAAPHVSGTLALILSANPGLTSTEAVNLLLRSCAEVGDGGRDPRFGAGLINAGRAVVGDGSVATDVLLTGERGS
ncbi:S8 family serine peptidase [Candidatus Bipolaricaulota bacterium]|nr:S8 family serine peptidase [Candidatus Bipolaricaulota bacterium]